MRAMTSRVEIVHLGGFKDTVTLDFDTLIKYKGDGECREVHCNHVCIGWNKFDTLVRIDRWILTTDADEENLITIDEGYVIGMKDKWMDDESAKSWAEKMNWDLQVQNQGCKSYYCQSSF